MAPECTRNHARIYTLSVSIIIYTYSNCSFDSRTIHSKIDDFGLIDVSALMWNWIIRRKNGRTRLTTRNWGKKEREWKKKKKHRIEKRFFCLSFLQFVHAKPSESIELKLCSCVCECVFCTLFDRLRQPIECVSKKATNRWNTKTKNYYYYIRTFIMNIKDRLSHEERVWIMMNMHTMCCVRCVCNRSAFQQNRTKIRCVRITQTAAATALTMSSSLAYRWHTTLCCDTCTLPRDGRIKSGETTLRSTTLCYDNDAWFIDSYIHTCTSERIILRLRS